MDVYPDVLWAWAVVIFAVVLLVSAPLILVGVWLWDRYKRSRDD